MTPIDWTKPIETDEENPMPARVLCTGLKNPYYSAAVVLTNQRGNDVVCMVNEHGCRDGVRIRNVLPKKVKREGWVNVFESKYREDVWRVAGGIYSSEDKAKTAVSCVGFGLIATTRIEWEEEE